MVQLVILPMVQLVVNGTIGLPMAPLNYQWQHWFTNGTVGRANGVNGITISTNGFTNGSIGRTLNTRLIKEGPRY